MTNKKVIIRLYCIKSCLSFHDLTNTQLQYIQNTLAYQILQVVIALRDLCREILKSLGLRKKS